MTAYTVHLERLDSIPLAVVRRQARQSELSRMVPELSDLVWNALRAQQISRTGGGWPAKAGRSRAPIITRERFADAKRAGRHEQGWLDLLQNGGGKARVVEAVCGQDQVAHFLVGLFRRFQEMETREPLADPKYNFSWGTEHAQFADRRARGVGCGGGPRTGAESGHPLSTRP